MATGSETDRLTELRAELRRRGLDAFVVPHSDEHQGEYLPPRAQRLTWLTGFTGSAGVAVVLAERAAIFVDGRYTLQVRTEVDGQRFEPLHLVEQPPHQWLAEALPAGARLGYDPWLHTADGVERLRQACQQASAELVACASNPVDAVWPDQPPPPLAPVVAHGLDYAGRSADDKRAEIGQALAATRLDAAVITAPDSLAWLLNVRGGDVPYAPLPLGFAIVRADGAVEVFLDRRKLTAGLDGHLGPAVTVAEPAELGAALDRLGAAGAKVRVDAASQPAWVLDRLTAAGARLDRGADPCALPKACKNPVELDGMRAAHRRDGAAMVRFLTWLAGRRPDQVTEMAAADRLEALRAEGPLFRGLSFPTIAGAGPNGAIVHYRSTERSNRALAEDSLFLLDSGAQYLDGTTDVTRTIAIGRPPDEARQAFTRVLAGHIALATIRFPAGTTGSQLDVLARRPLWEAGLNYDHGTGHGVGSYLGVHEGPQRISTVASTVALKPGMVVSNEPGYYRAGAWGIRIENLVAVVPSPGPAEREMLAFETLTLVPIDRALIEPALLSPAERAWLDGYHVQVFETLVPLVGPAERAWLAQATRPLGERS